MTFLLLLPWTKLLNAQADIPYERLKFQRLTIEDGLSQGMVTSIAQDDFGFLWFATKDGLNKYDGYHFVIYRHNNLDNRSIADNYIHTVKTDSRGLLWILYMNGEIDIFNPRTEFAFHLTAYYPQLKVTSVFCYRMAEKNSGDVVIFSESDCALLKLIPQPGAGGLGYSVALKYKALEDIIQTKLIVCPSLFFSANDDMFVSNRDSILVFHNPELDDITPENARLWPAVDEVDFTVQNSTGDPNELCGIVAEDTLNNRYLILNGNSFALCDTRTGRITDEMSFGFDFGGNYVRNALFDDQGRVWFLTYKEIFQYDPLGRRLVKLLAQDPNIKDMHFHYASSIFMDRSGVMWIGTSGYGLLRYNKLVERFRHVSGADDELYSVQDIVEDKRTNALWLRLPDGYYAKYDLNTSALKLVDAPALMTIGELNSPLGINPKMQGAGFLPDQDGYLIMRKPMICYLDSSMNVLSSMRAEKSDRIANATSYRDELGNTWVATGLGREFVLRKLNAQGKKEVASYWFPVQQSDMPYAFTSAMLSDKRGNLWIGTLEGLFRFNIAEETWTHFNVKKELESGLPVKSIFSLCDDPEDENILWVGTNGGGLVRFERNSGHCTTFDVRSGLPNNVIYGILADETSNLWISTNNGLASFNTLSHEIRIFTTKDGLQGNEFNRYASYKLSNGDLVFGGMNGFNLFNPRAISENLFQPNVIFTSFRIGNKEVTLRADSTILNAVIAATSELFLRHSQNFITLSFASTDYTATDKLFYQYKMEGIDKDWLPSTRLNEATYTNLDPGTYTFRVRGTNSDGLWSPHEASILIHIAPPWWGTWWFISLLVALGVLAVVSFYRYRLKQATELLILRNRIASDLHDEIGSTLSSISLYSEAATRLVSGNDKAVSVLSRINSNTTEIMEAMSDIVWAINTRNDQLDNLANRMRSFAVQICEAGHIELHMSDNENLPDMPLDMYERKNIYLIFKEAVNNAAKYAQCRNLYIDFSSKNHILEIRIKDDGIGFVPSEIWQAQSSSTGGNGLINMRKRAEDLRGSLEVNSAPGKGTEVVLFIRMK